MMTGLYNKVNKNIISNIIYLRKANDLSQEKFGNILGITKQALYKIEKGKSAISIHHLCVISEYFNIPLSDLIIKDISLNEK